jgi:alginate O-acetyltransferase complex protein AlgJ
MSIVAVGSPLETSVASFKAICTEKVAAVETAGASVVPGLDGWLFFAPGLRHMAAGPFWGEAAAAVSKATKPETADPLPAILDFKRQLDGLGVRLIMVPVPDKAVIAPEKLDASLAAEPRLDPDHLDFYELLRAEGVEVLDLTPVFLAERQARPDSLLYCKTDTHWSGEGIAVAARELAKMLRPADAIAPADPAYGSEWREVELQGDLARMSVPPIETKETVRLNFVGSGAPPNLAPVETDPAAPVLLLGDSHTLVFHIGEDLYARGAGLPDQLALELGAPVDLIGVRGSGATPARISLARKARSQPDYLKGKSAVVWCFAAREFTESSGWSLVPVVR